MLIDTNVYSALNKGHQAAARLIGAQQSIYVPVVVVGELRYGFAYGTKQVENEEQLNRFIASTAVELLYISHKTTELYAELAAYCRRSGRVLSDNDLWIAALAQEHGLSLATYDKDFEVLRSEFGSRLKIL
ncbi:MAG: type II toxin-antitoxin system VapC family toxin [Candidatus Saccharibacteria bacterium]|nr:type II toxin-antitoxin system VapC family toxin [Candidatus Saccharibacteria bacterium]